MNKKGFTLIELLAVIVLIGIVGIIVVPSVLDDLKVSKNKSYEILVNNIKVAAENYYQECEYGDLEDIIKKDTTKYGNCTFKRVSDNEHYIELPLITLANTGFLTVSEVDESNNKVILDPRDKTNNMNECTIKIIKKTDNGKVTYTVAASTGENCPTTDEYQGE